MKSGEVCRTEIDSGSRKISVRFHQHSYKFQILKTCKKYYLGNSPFDEFKFTKVYLWTFSEPWFSTLRVNFFSTPRSYFVDIRLKFQKVPNRTKLKVKPQIIQWFLNILKVVTYPLFLEGMCQVFCVRDELHDLSCKSQNLKNCKKCLPGNSNFWEIQTHQKRSTFNFDSWSSS